MTEYEEKLEQAQLEIQMVNEELRELRAGPAGAPRDESPSPEANVYASSPEPSRAPRPFTRIPPGRSRKIWRP